VKAKCFSRGLQLQRESLGKKFAPANRTQCLQQDGDASLCEATFSVPLAGVSSKFVSWCEELTEKGLCRHYEIVSGLPRRFYV